MMFRKYILLFCALCHSCNGGINYKEVHDVEFHIAGIFDKEHETNMLAFNESAKDATNVSMLKLKPIVLQPYRTDSFSFWNELCSAETIRPVVIFGPQHPDADGAVRAQCIANHIPHVQATWQPNEPEVLKQEEEEENAEAEDGAKDTEEQDNTPIFRNITINFIPDSDEIAKAYAELLKYHKWESFAVLYEDEYGLRRVQKILAEHSDRYPITVRRLDPKVDNHKVFKELYKYQQSRILLDCHVDRIMKYMGEANRLNMVNPYQHYVLTSMDGCMQADALTKYQSNFTWLSLIDCDSLKGTNYLSNRVWKWTSDKQNPQLASFETEALILDDVTTHILEALNAINATEEQADVGPCEEGGQYSLGALLQDSILKTKSKGQSGNIEFDENGKRVNYTLLINDIYVSKRENLARWESKDGEIKKDREINEISAQQASKHFNVITRIAKPYYSKITDFAGMEPNENGEMEQYEGFTVDFVKEIFNKLKEANYNYTYSIMTDPKYDSAGTYDEKTKRWTGMIGDLLDKKADLAVCDITITEERKKVVDFSVPFMHFGISILSKTEEKVAPNMFAFLIPYEFEVWMYTLTAYCVVTIILFVCSRISPADWENPQPCDKDPEELENIWNFKNCAWLTMGSIMTQGCDILPKAIGSRWVCGMWWFFALIVCQSYIAMFSANLTTQLNDQPINSVEDLSKQSRVLYGAMKGGATLEFFKNSKDKMYQRMYDTMMYNPVVLVSDIDEGEKRVKHGKNKYVFFMESPTIEYKRKRDCELTQIGGLLDSKLYGIAMPANSPFRAQINRAVLSLTEDSRLSAIKTKWWEEKDNATNCKEDVDESDVEGDLEMADFIGVFYVLIGGMVIAVLIAFAEFFNEIRNIVVRENVSHKEAFMKELKASMDFSQLQKPVLRNLSRVATAVTLPTTGVTPPDKLDQRATAITDFMAFEKMQM